jgi:CRP-like cAMP-binding protein
MGNDPNSVLISRLRNVPLFAGIENSALHEIANECRIRKFRATNPLFYHGSDAPGLHVILSGEVTLHRDLGKFDTLAFATRKAGDCLGEISLLDGGEATATVVAKTDVTAAVLRPADFERILTESPAVARALLKSMAQRLRETTDLLASAHSQTLRQRLFEFLCQNADGNDRVQIDSQKAVGERIGGTRETVNRELKQLCDQGKLKPLAKKNHYWVNRDRL